MIRGVSIGEEIVITAKNKVGLLADIAMTLASQGVNIEAALGYQVGDTATLMLVTNANLAIMDELRKKKYTSIKEIEVVIVDLDNKPGALKVVTTELSNKKIDIMHLYVTSSPVGRSSKMILETSDNEDAMALLSKYTEPKTPPSETCM